MKTYKSIVELAILLLALVAQISEGKIRHRRHVEQLAGLIECQTGRSAFDYLSYGCWCGIGGSEEPVDDVDRCCYEHDKCFDDVTDTGVCDHVTMYTHWYSYYSKESACPRQKELNCSVEHGECAFGLCQCDEKISYCLSQAGFNEKHRAYSRFFGCSTRKFLCSWFGC